MNLSLDSLQFGIHQLHPTNVSDMLKSAEAEGMVATKRFNTPNSAAVGDRGQALHFPQQRV